MRLAARRLAAAAATTRPLPPPRPVTPTAAAPGRCVRLGTCRRHTVSTAAASGGTGDWSLYTQPELYDAVFDLGRDYGAEIAFITAALATHGARPSLATFLDVGCGPAHHARAAAVAGASVSIALDSSCEMLNAASVGAAADGVTITPLAADFTAPYDVPAPVDAALMALGTLAHATEPHAPTSTFAALASALAPGGIAILELPPTADVFDGSLIAGDAWDVDACQATGGVDAVLEYGAPEDDFNPIDQILTRTVILSQIHPDTGAIVKELGRERVRQRLFTPAEVRALARGAGLEVAAELGDFDASSDARDGDRYVVVLRKP